MESVLIYNMIMIMFLIIRFIRNARKGEKCCRRPDSSCGGREGGPRRRLEKEAFMQTGEEGEPLFVRE
jgi:hypothetical protein